MRLKQSQYCMFPFPFVLSTSRNVLAYLIIFANEYQLWKVKFIQLWGEKNAVTHERRKGRQSAGVMQLASQHMLYFLLG